MKVILLDTDIVSYAMSGRYPQLREPFKQHSGNLAISSITYQELIFGCENGGMTERCRQRVNAIIQGFSILAFDAKAAEISAGIEVNLKQQGMPIGQIDTMIAEHTLSVEGVLVTKNDKHFKRVRGLTIEQWATF